jgi:uncharacterized protein (DUF1330 family)
MSAYTIVDIVVHDPERYQEYVSIAPGFVAKHEGRYIVRGGDVAVAEGDWQPERLVVVEFPSLEHAHAFLQDPDYQSVAAIRHAATTSNLIVVDGFDIA